MKILAIETSCDETAAAVVENGYVICSNIIASSSTMHAKYGGIVPEIAAREQLNCIIPTIEEALHQAGETIDTIDALAVTIGPGLIGSLLVGVETAKTIAFVKQKPVIPVHHVLAHMYANFIDSSHVIPDTTRNPPFFPNSGSRLYGRDDNASIQFPAISLVVSGGHTELFLMSSQKELQWLGGTLDDAAGECFDKSARLLGFENRGGVAIQEAAAQYRPGQDDGRFRLPRPMLDSSNELNFSFSGLKTAILREVQSQKSNDSLDSHTVQRLANEIQESVSDVLVKKTIRAAVKFSARSILVSGGVSANIRLREKFRSVLDLKHPEVALHIPPIALCTDNAVYIAAYAYFRGAPANWHDIAAVPDLSVENIP